MDLVDFNEKNVENKCKLPK